MKATSDNMLIGQEDQDHKKLIHSVIFNFLRHSPILILLIVCIFFVVTAAAFHAYTNTVRKQSETLHQDPPSIPAIPTTTESTISPIETWNKDTDSLNGLSFKYPKEWKITDREPELIVILTSWYLPYNRSIEIEVKDNRAQLSQQDFLMQDLEEFFDEEVLSGVRIEPVSGSTIGGVRTIGIPEGFSNILSMFVANYNDKMLEITLLSGGEIGGNVGVPAAQEDEYVFLQVINSLEIFRSVTPRPVSPGWQTYTDDKLDFSIQYPINWYESDLSKSPSFKGRCFGDNSEGPMYSTADFCVDLNPWVRPSSLEGNASNVSEAQQGFFQELANREVGQPLVVNTNQYTVVRHFEIANSPAIERIETDAPGTDGYEQSHIVAVYINHPTLGLIRLTMGAFTREEFEQHENVLRQMLDSFTLLN